MQVRELVVGIRHEVQTMNSTKFVAIEQALKEVKQQIQQVETTAEPLFKRASDQIQKLEEASKGAKEEFRVLNKNVQKHQADQSQRVDGIFYKITADAAAKFDESDKKHAELLDQAAIADQAGPCQV